MIAPLYMLDSDIVSYAIRGRSHSVDAKLAAVGVDRICISVVTRAELFYGIQRLSTAHPIYITTVRFLQDISTIPWDSEAADIYAEIRHQLTSSGRPIGDRDTMIAAHAMSLGAILVTNNVRHHGRLAPPLVLENWTTADS